MSESTTIRDPWKEIEKLQHHVELYRRLWHEAKKGRNIGKVNTMNCIMDCKVS